MGSRSNTYHCYKRALQAIADGAPNPVALAKAALPMPRVPTPKPVKPARDYEEQARIRRERAIALFERWHAQGRPKKTVFAQTEGLTYSQTLVGLERGYRVLRHPSNKHHPLYAVLRREAGYDD